MRMMELGYKSIRERNRHYMIGAITLNEYISWCLGYLQALLDCGLLNNAQHEALMDYVTELL